MPRTVREARQWSRSFGRSRFLGKELGRVFNSYDEQRADIQRQLDEVKQAQGSVYGARDILLDLRERIDRMVRQRLSGVGG